MSGAHKSAGSAGFELVRHLCFAPETLLLLIAFNYRQLTVKQQQLLDRYMQLKVILGFVSALGICNTSFPFVSLLSLKKEAKLKMETVKMLFL